jgi:glycopeptide antibiotics resistance protein
MRAMHVIHVRKGTTVALLVFTSGVMVAMLYLLSGRAYAAETHPYREIVARILGSSGPGPVSRDALLAFLMPVIANILLFMPWGFLAFLALDSPKRSRTSTYSLTVLAAVLFAAAMFVWQQFLPTRVTSPFDTIANAAGALAGAALGHARKAFRVRFDR